MRRLERLSGDDVIAILGRFGIAVHPQRGSHVKLRRTSPTGEKQSITVPRHSELDVGAVRSIIRQTSRYVPEDDLGPHFYSD